MIPLIINNPESMVKVRVMTVKDYSEQTLKTLHRIGVLHVEEAKEFKPIDRAVIESERREVSELLTFVDSVLSYIPQKEQVSLGEDVEVIYTRSFSEISGEVKSLYNKVNNLYERTVKLNDEVQQLTEPLRYLEPLTEQGDFKLRDLNFSGDYLFSRVFVLPSETYETLYARLKNYLLQDIVASAENEHLLYVIAKVRDQKTIESIVTDAGGKILPMPDEDLPLRDFLKITNGKIRSLEEELTKLRQELQNKVREDLKRIALLREALSAEKERLSVLEKACEAKYVTLIEGWIPESDTESAISEVRESIDYVFIDTRKPEPQEEPPTKLNNLRGFKPFQVIVNLFGTPKYREWDPTPIVAYSFAFFFGIMLCDVVYGFGVILLAKFLLSKFVDDPHTEGFKQFQNLLYISGGVSLILGLLSGSYLADIYKLFGVESLALVDTIEQILQDPMSFIGLAIVVGLVHINIAYLMALIKGVKEIKGAKKKNVGIILGRAGLFLLQICGVPLIMHAILSVDIPLLTEQAYSVLTLVMFPSIILVIVGAILESGGMGAIMWLFTITGILGDVMSYSRLAGVGLATVYLASSFNMLAGLFRDMISGMIPGIAGLIFGSIVAFGVLFLGHTINLLMSTITGFVHSLRLCFLEFLSKFYEGSGTEYSPFKLRKRIAVLL